jgi:hypothetical protein
MAIVNWVEFVFIIKSAQLYSFDIVPQAYPYSSNL